MLILAVINVPQSGTKTGLHPCTVSQSYHNVVTLYVSVMRCLILTVTNLLLSLMKRDFENRSAFGEVYRDRLVHSERPMARFYCAMHYSGKRDLAFACRLSVCLFVCDVGGSWPHRLKILETNCTINYPTSLLFVAQRSSTYSQGNMEKFWEENVRSTSTSIT